MTWFLPPTNRVFWPEGQLLTSEEVIEVYSKRISNGYAPDEDDRRYVESLVNDIAGARQTTLPESENALPPTLEEFLLQKELGEPKAISLMTVEETFNNYLGNYHRQFDQASTDDVNRQLLELVIGEIEPKRAKFFEEVTKSQVEAAKERAIERENFQLAVDAIDIPGLSWGQIGVSPVLALGDVLEKYTKWVLKAYCCGGLNHLRRTP